MEKPEIIQVTRQELYERIWSESFSKVSLKYGLSNAALARLCEEWQIPRPSSDYWVQKRNGQKTKKKRLTRLPEGNPVVLTYRHMTVEEVEEVLQYSQSFDQRILEKKPENRIVVPDRLIDPHPLVKQTRTSLRDAAPDPFGRVRPTAPGCLNLCVFPENVRRGLLIFDTILKALQRRGYPVSVEGQTGHTQAEVLGEKIGFRVYEATKRQEGNREDSGRLVLKIINGQERCWTDSPSRRIEQALNAFVVGLVAAAENIKRRRSRAEKQRQEQLERERQRKEQERQQQEEESRRQAEKERCLQLEAEAAAWTKAVQIRSYVAAVRQVAIEDSGEILPGGILDGWLRWAEEYANVIDPLIGKAWQ